MTARRIEILLDRSDPIAELQTAFTAGLLSADDYMAAMDQLGEPAIDPALLDGAAVPNGFDDVGSEASEEEDNGSNDLDEISDPDEEDADEDDGTADVDALCSFTRKTSVFQEALDLVDAGSVDFACMFRALTSIPSDALAKNYRPGHQPTSDNKCANGCGFVFSTEGTSRAVVNAARDHTAQCISKSEIEKQGPALQQAANDALIGLTYQPLTKKKLRGDGLRPGRLLHSWGENLVKSKEGPRACQTCFSSPTAPESAKATLLSASQATEHLNEYHGLLVSGSAAPGTYPFQAIYYTHIASYIVDPAAISAISRALVEERILGAPSSAYGISDSVLVPEGALLEDRVEAPSDKKYCQIVLDGHTVRDGLCPFDANDPTMAWSIRGFPRTAHPHDFAKHVSRCIAVRMNSGDPSLVNDEGRLKCVDPICSRLNRTFNNRAEMLNHYIAVHNLRMSRRDKPSAKSIGFRGCIVQLKDVGFDDDAEVDHFIEVFTKSKGGKKQRSKRGALPGKARAQAPSESSDEDMIYMSEDDRSE